MASAHPSPPVELHVGRSLVFDLLSIRNRRFMYCRRTYELILGGNDIARSSHAAEHGISRAQARYDEFVRGWVGFSGAYPHGVIHFAPGFRECDLAEDPDATADLHAALAMFAANGASAATILRAAATGAFEMPFGKAYPEFFRRAKRLTFGAALASC